MAHQPLQFGPHPRPDRDSPQPADAATPLSLDLKRDEALTVTWSDGRVSVYPVGHLRRLSPSAETRELHDRQAANPLTVLPAAMFGAGPLRAESAELVGNYALRICFSDGHDSGLYSWAYLRQIDPDRPTEGKH